MSEAFYDALGLSGTVIMICGAWWRWNHSRRQSHVEEAEKDGKISREEARRRLWRVRQWPAQMVLLGITLVAIAAFELLSH